MSNPYQKSINNIFKEAYKDVDWNSIIKDCLVYGNSTTKIIIDDPYFEEPIVQEEFDESTLKTEIQEFLKK